MKLASLVLPWHPFAILVGTAVACAIWAATDDPGSGLAWLRNPGAHGFSEMLYEFSSAAANNGSGFEGLGDDTPFWNVSTGLVMRLSRYVPIVPRSPSPGRWRPSRRRRTRRARCAPTALPSPSRCSPSS